MNLPKKITVVGRPYEINVVDAPKDNGQICWGTTDYGKSLIEICSSLNETAKKQTLVHELIHATMWEMGQAENCNDENIVNPLANGLYQMLTNNDDLIDMLLRK
jgi:hypothetical protein